MKDPEEKTVWAAFAAAALAGLNVFPGNEDMKALNPEAAVYIAVEQADALLAEYLSRYPPTAARPGVSS